MKNIKDLQIFNNNTKFFIQWQRSDEYLYYLLEESLEGSIVGQSCQYQIWPLSKDNIPIPSSYNNDYQSEFYDANTESIKKLLASVNSDLIIALMPYGNLETYNELIALKGRIGNVISTASLSEIALKNPRFAIDLQCEIENKVIFNQMLKDAWCDNATEISPFEYNQNYMYRCKQFKVQIWRPLFIMRTDQITAGWSWLRCIRSQSDLDCAVSDWLQSKWSYVIVRWVWDASENNEYIPTYSANWRFVCVPDPQDATKPIIYSWKLTKKPTWFTVDLLSPEKSGTYQLPPFSAVGDDLNPSWEDCYYESYITTIDKYVSYLYRYIYQKTGQYLPLQWGLDFVVDKKNKKLIATEVNLRKQGPDYFLQFLDETQMPLDKFWLLYKLTQRDEVKDLLANVGSLRYDIDTVPNRKLWYIKLRPIAWRRWTDLVDDRERVNNLEGIYKKWEKWWFQITGSEGYTQIQRYLYEEDGTYVYFTPPKISNTKEWFAYKQESYILGSGSWFDADTPNLTDEGYQIMEEFYNIVIRK